MPAELHPPSLKIARSKHDPEAHSLSALHVALAGLLLLALLQAVSIEIVIARSHPHAFVQVVTPLVIGDSLLRAAIHCRAS